MAGRRGSWTRRLLVTRKQRRRRRRKRKRLQQQLLRRQLLLKLLLRRARPGRWRRRQCRSSAASFAACQLPLSAVSALPLSLPLLLCHSQASPTTVVGTQSHVPQRNHLRLAYVLESPAVLDIGTASNACLADTGPAGLLYCCHMALCTASASCCSDTA